MPTAQRKPSARSLIAPVLALNATTQANEYELLIYGDIGASWWEETVTAANVIAQLDALPPSVTSLHVRINSLGGSVPDGLAIYNALKRCPAQVTVTVDGVAASIASFIAMAGDEVRAPATSVIMVHDPRLAWVEDANASSLRSWADQLDVWSTSMAAGYAAKTGLSVDEVMTQFLDGVDHFFAGEEAVAAGLVDTLETFEPVVEPEPIDPTLTASLPAFVAHASEHIRQLVIAAAVRHPVAVTTQAKPRVRVAATAVTSPAPVATTTGVSTMPNPVQAVVAEPAADAAAITAQAHAALRTRNTEIHAVLEPYMQRTGVSALYTAALADPSATVDSVRAQLLPILGGGAEPAGSAMHVEMGATEREKMRGAAEQMLLARYNVIGGAEADAARQGNPFGSSNIVGIAERMLIASGVNTRTMGREEIARRVLASQTSSDFPVLLENVLHKILIGGYNATPFTWTRFCATGTLVDYRPHGRYHLSSFSDLKVTNERGEYENGVLGDGQKETIQGVRKGRILEITPEVLINDDLGALVRVAGALGQAAGRTIEKDVYALFAMNGGAGPMMSDGNPLFHTAHANIAATPAVVGVASFDAARVQMANQMDPGGNDFLDIMPAIWLGPLSLGGAARVTNRSEFDPDANSKLQRPNIVRDVFKDIIDTPRLSGTAWYALADAASEPVFEVAFLDGVQTPTLEQELNFRTDGIAWKAAHRYGAAAIGWRGAIKNAGA
jgi:ATP-dependent protease ClpP protease subunit